MTVATTFHHGSCGPGSTTRDAELPSRLHGLRAVRARGFNLDDSAMGTETHVAPDGERLIAAPAVYRDGWPRRHQLQGIARSHRPGLLF
jgi:hypothetical protein